MKNTLFSIVTGLAMLSLLPSCKDFLELLPTQNIPASQSIGNVQDAQNALNGVYRALTSSAYYGRDMLLYADLKGGDMGLVGTAIAGDGLYFFSHTPNSGSLQGYWNQIFYIILQTNNILSNVDSGNVTIGSAADQTNLNNIVGQTFAIRGLCHFDLARLYGYPYLKDNGASLGAPIVTEMLPANYQGTRSTVAECYTQAISDLTEAVSLLSTTRKNGAINKYGAQAILSKIYLYKGDYNNAYEMARSIIDAGVYTPFTASNWVASWKTQGASESIFELFLVPNENDLGSSSFSSYFGPRRTSRNDLGSVMVSDIFFDMFNNYPEDVRWELFGYDEFHNLGTIPERRGWLQKYEGDGKSNIRATNNKIIRITEVLLIAAEAAVEKASPDFPSAVNWVNIIRQRDPSLPDLTADASKTEILNEIERQRRIEFIGEGQRYFDVLRKGGTVYFRDGGFFPPPQVGNRGESVDWNYHRCVLPIGQDELNANPALISQQNPGY